MLGRDPSHIKGEKRRLLNTLNEWYGACFILWMQSTTTEHISEITWERRDLFTARIGDRPIPKPAAIDYRSGPRCAFKTISPSRLGHMCRLTWDAPRHDR
jgi:hypothetical protein